MAENIKKNLKHLILNQAPASHKYRSTKRGGGSFVLKAKETRPHGDALRRQLTAIENDETRLRTKNQALLPTAQRSDFGIIIEVEVSARN